MKPSVFQFLLFFATLGLLAVQLPVGAFLATVSRTPAKAGTARAAAPAAYSFVTLTPDVHAKILRHARMSWSNARPMSEPDAHGDYAILRDPLPAPDRLPMPSEVTAPVALPLPEPSFGVFSVPYPPRAVTRVGPEAEKAASEPFGREALLDLSDYTSMKEEP